LALNGCGSAPTAQLGTFLVGLFFANPSFVRMSLALFQAGKNPLWLVVMLLVIRYCKIVYYYYLDGCFSFTIVNDEKGSYMIFCFHDLKNFCPTAFLLIKLLKIFHFVEATTANHSINNNNSTRAQAM
jgi:hypothetical protein